VSTNAPTSPPDLVLALRLDALLKNFQQIRDTRSAVEERGNEVYNLRHLAKDHQLGIDYRLSDLGEDVISTQRRLTELVKAKVVSPQAIERPVENLERAADVIAEVRGDFQQMLQIIERMSERWVQGASLETLERTLLHESNMRITKIEDYQGQLGDPDAGRAAIWDDYEDLAYREGAGLFGEYVDFIGGVALRNTGIDHGVCQMADDLVARLYRIGSTELFHSMTLPTRRVASERTVARIIRMGFPEWTVWAVPLGAHEFGHVVINDSDLRSSIDDAGQRWGFDPPVLDTLFADAFATSVMGPAYAYAAILLNLDPCGEDAEARAAARRSGAARSCPVASPDSRRAHVILRTLELMGEADSSYEGVRRTLVEAWTETLEAFGLAFELDGEATQLDKCAKFIWDFLSTRASHVIYTAGRYAELDSWPDLLTPRPVNGDGDGDGDGSDPRAGMRRELEVRDVLNMAWRERIAKVENRTGQVPDQIAAAALALWRERFESGPATNPFPQPVRGDLR
jgi:hypothetical protein